MNTLKAALSPLDELSKRMQEISSPLEKAMAAFKSPLEGMNTNLFGNINVVPRMPVDDFVMPKLPPMKSIWKIQAELFMDGLQKQVKELERGLQSDEELSMTCWHGHERFQVLSISMPSQNVVALCCVDDEGNHVQLTGHMNSVTFSFRIHKIQPPAKRNNIGFVIPD